MDDILVLLIVAICAGLALLSMAKKRASDITPSELAKGAFVNFEAPVLPRSKADIPDYIESEAVDRALWRIAEYVCQDFVTHWFQNLSDDSDFPNDVRDMLDFMFSKLARNASEVDWTAFVANVVLVQFKDLFRMLRYQERRLIKSNPWFKQAARAEQTAMLKDFIKTNFRGHAAVRCSEKERVQYLRKLSAALASELLRPRDYAADAVRSLAREIVTNGILQPTMGFADPYWVNCGIVAIYESTVASDESDNTQATGEEDTSHVDEQLDEKLAQRDMHRRAKSTMEDLVKQHGLKKADVQTQSLAFDSVKRNQRRAGSGRAQPGFVRANSASANSAEGHATGAASSPALSPALTAEQTNTSPVTHSALDVPSNGDDNHYDSAQLDAADTQRTSDSATTTGSTDNSVPAGTEAGAAAEEKEQAAEVKGNTQFAHEWDVTILHPVTKFDPRPYVEYRMRVQNGQYSWLVSKRFKQFAELHDQVMKRVPEFHAQLPKKQFFGNLDKKFVTERQIELQKYITSMLWTVAVVETVEFRLFFQPPMDSPLIPVASVKAEEAKPIAKYSSADLLERSRSQTLAQPPTINGGIGEKPKRHSVPNVSVLADTTAADPSPQKGLKKRFLRKFGFGKTRSKSERSAGEVLLSVDVHTPNADTDGQAEGNLSPQSAPSSDDGAFYSPSEKQELNSPSGNSNDRLPISSGYTKSPSVEGVHLASAPSSPLPSAGEHKSLSPAPRHSVRARRRNQQRRSNSLDAAEKEETKQQQLIKEAAAQKTRMSVLVRSRIGQKPLLGAVDEIFAVSERGIVRRQLAWMLEKVVAVLMDKTINKWFHSQVEYFTSEAYVVWIIEWITSLIWPGGKLIGRSEEKVSDELKKEYEEKCYEALKKSIPKSLPTLLGQKAVDNGVTRLYQFLQIEPLVSHMAFTVLDAVIIELFPNLKPLLSDSHDDFRRYIV